MSARVRRPRWCQVHHEFGCRCTQQARIIVGRRCTIFPASNMVSVDGSLYGLMISAFTPWYVEVMFKGIERGAHRVSEPFLLMGAVCQHISLLTPLPSRDNIVETLWWSGQRCNRQVRRIQAWWRRARRAWRDRRLAVCMGCHPRLGGASPFSRLQEDVVRLILRA